MGTRCSECNGLRGGKKGIVIQDVPPGDLRCQWAVAAWDQTCAFPAQGCQQLTGEVREVLNSG